MTEERDPCGGGKKVTSLSLAWKVVVPPQEWVSFVLQPPRFEPGRGYRGLGRPSLQEHSDLNLPAWRGDGGSTSFSIKPGPHGSQVRWMTRKPAQTDLTHLLSLTSPHPWHRPSPEAPMSHPGLPNTTTVRRGHYLLKTPDQWYSVTTPMWPPSASSYCLYSQDPVACPRCMALEEVNATVPQRVALPLLQKLLNSCFWPYSHQAMPLSKFWNLHEWQLPSFKRS